LLRDFFSTSGCVDGAVIISIIGSEDLDIHSSEGKSLREWYLIKRRQIYILDMIISLTDNMAMMSGIDLVDSCIIDSRYFPDFTLFDQFIQTPIHGRDMDIRIDLLELGM
jgi:hypothetical protein